MPAGDVLIVGGGIVGLMTAIELAEAGARVTVVDAGQNAGSTANAGSLHVQMQSRFIRLYPEHAPNVEAALPIYKQSADLWVRLEQRLGPFDLVRKGGLMLAEGDRQMAFLEQKARKEAKKGLDVTLLDRTALDKVAPWLAQSACGQCAADRALRHSGRPARGRPGYGSGCLLRRGDRVRRGEPLQGRGGRRRRRVGDGRVAEGTGRRYPDRGGTASHEYYRSLPDGD